MKKKQKLFQLYAGNSRASNLSVAGGAVKLLSILLIIAAILCTLALLISGLRITMAGGLGTALVFLIDELDDELFTALFLWGLVVTCRYIACVLQEKARMLAQPNQPNNPTEPELPPVS